MTINTSDEKTIDLTSPGRRLKLASRDRDLSIINGILTYGGADVFVSGLHVGQLNCTFGSKAQLLDFVIED